MSGPPPPPGITGDQATFVGFVVEGILWGANSVLFALAIYVLMGGRSARGTHQYNYPMLLATLLLFGMCTAHFWLEFANAYIRLMVHPGGPLSDENGLLRGADTLFSVTDFVAQLVLIYRCYMMWNRKIWVILFPLLVAMTSVGCAMAGVGIVALIAPTANTAPSSVVPLGIAAFSLSLAVNVLATSLLVARIYLLAHVNPFTSLFGSKNRHQAAAPVIDGREMNDQLGGDKLVQGAHGPMLASTRGAVHGAMGVLIESGALFLAVQLIFVVLFALEHPAQAILVPSAVQIYGISPTLIIVRVGLGRSYDTVPPNTTSTGEHSSIGFFGPNSRPAFWSFGARSRQVQSGAGSYGTGTTRTAGGTDVDSGGKVHEARGDEKVGRESKSSRGSAM